MVEAVMVSKAHHDAPYLAQERYEVTAGLRVADFMMCDVNCD